MKLIPHLRGAAIGLLSSVAALVFAAAAAWLILAATGASPLEAARAMVLNGFSDASAAIILNSAAAYYLSAVAVAFTFRLNLFNIGTEGQYRIAALCAAAVGAGLSLPAPLGQVVIVTTAMIAGAVWAAIPALLKTLKGVNEVISTIALNFIAIGLISYLLAPGRLGSGSGSNMGTAPIADGLRDSGIDIAVQGAGLHWSSLLAVAAGIGFYVLIERTVFGFDLRAAGRSVDAARTGGVPLGRTIVIAMVLSGATAGLIGMPALLGDSGSFTLSFPSGLGFIGIAVALFGGNRAAGMAVGALLFSFLDNSSNVLQLMDISNEVVRIMEGLIILAVVITNRLTSRWRTNQARPDRLKDMSAAPAAPAPVNAGGDA
ncbi:ABC transporter permease [Nonomuraea sp. NPDC050786]|uniref:ABC transporter permease n=1 Tax=Nonomuraea sp. NPDC050786 TaxID=3154840 RepID=UPI0033EC494A